MLTTAVVVNGPSVETKVKENMGYIGPERHCKNCGHFVPADCSGNQNAKDKHCTLNPAIDLPVDEEGTCRFFRPKGV